MRLGVNVPNFGPGASPGMLAAWAAKAEESGYDLLMVSDHVAVTPDVAKPYPAPFFDPFATLAYLAARTERIGLGTTVLIAPYRHPLVTAQAAASVQLLSGGRLTLGIGVGWARQEYDALGLPFEKRGAITDDYLRALDAAWADDGRGAAYQGTYTRFADVASTVAAAGHRPPPIWIGGNSTSALRRAVRHGAAWHPLGLTPEQSRDALERLRDLAQAEGRAVPAFAPRIKLRRDADGGGVDDTLTQLHALRQLGAETVVLDTYLGDPEETRDPTDAWDRLSAVISGWKES